MASTNGAPRSVPLTCSGHTRPVVHLDFSDLQDDGTYTLLSSCKDGKPMLRDWLGDWVGTFLGHKGAVWCGKLSGGDAARAVTGSADFTAKVWDTYSGACLLTLPHNHIVRSTAIDAAGARALTGGHEKKIRLFDLNQPEQPRYLAAPGAGGDGLAHSDVVKYLVWDRSAGGGENTFVSGGDDKVIRWWDLRTEAPVRELTLDHPITSLQRTPGKLGELLSVTSGNDALFYNASDGQLVKKFTLAEAPSSASVQPVEGDRFITGTVGDGWVRVYDWASGAQRELFKGHHGPAHVVSYAPDGQLAASGSEDGTIRLWQTFPGTQYGLWTS